MMLSTIRNPIELNRQLLINPYVNPLDSRDVLAQDSFDRPNGQLGFSDMENMWKVIDSDGFLRIVSWRAEVVIGGAANQFYGIDAKFSDVLVEVTLVAVGAAPYLIFRALDSNNFMAVSISATGLYTIVRRIDGVSTVLATSAYPSNANDNIKLFAFGSSLRLFVNNIPILSVTSTVNWTNTICGIGGSTSVGTIWDDFRTSESKGNYAMIEPNGNILPSRVVGFDNFNRADGSPGTAQVGGSWTAISGSGKTISGNQLLINAAGTQTMAIKTYNIDGEISMTLVALFGRPILAFRLAGNSDHNLFSTDGTNYIIQTKIAGAYTTIATSAVAPVNGDVMRVTFSGADIRAYVNGVLIMQVSSTANTSASNIYTGLGGSSAAGLILDNFVSLSA